MIGPERVLLATLWKVDVAGFARCANGGRVSSSRVLAWEPSFFIFYMSKRRVALFEGRMFVD